MRAMINSVGSPDQNTKSIMPPTLHSGTSIRTPHHDSSCCEMVELHEETEQQSMLVCVGGSLNKQKNAGLVFLGNL